jgi:hypothetical protein
MNAIVLETSDAPVLQASIVWGTLNRQPDESLFPGPEEATWTEGKTPFLLQ